MTIDAKELAIELGATLTEYKGTVDDLGWLGADFTDRGNANKFAAMLGTSGFRYKGPFAPVEGLPTYLVQFHV